MPGTSQFSFFLFYSTSDSSGPGPVSQIFEIITLVFSLFQSQESILQERKRTLLNLNVGVHRFSNDCTRSMGPASTTAGIILPNVAIQSHNKTVSAATIHLKDRIADLYRLLTDTNNR